MDGFSIINESLINHAALDCLQTLCKLTSI